MSLTTIWSFIIPQSELNLYYYKEKEFVISTIQICKEDSDQIKKTKTFNGNINESKVQVNYSTNFF